MNAYSIFISAALSGIYTVIVYSFVSSFILIKPRIEQFTFIVFLYAFGFLKHEIGYYMTIESSYCKQTGVCDETRKDSATIKNYLGFAENVWFEAAGEGIIFVIVGIPVFLLLPSKYHVFSALITGILAHFVAEYSNFHKYFCRDSCNIIPNLELIRSAAGA